MCAEQQLQAVGEQGPDIGPGAAAVTSVQGGKRRGLVPGRRLTLLLPVSASGPESASAQDDHLRRSPGSAIPTPPQATADGKAMAPVVLSPVPMAPADEIPRPVPAPVPRPPAPAKSR